MKIVLGLLLGLLMPALPTVAQTRRPSTRPAAAVPAATPELQQLQTMAARLAPTPLRVDLSQLSAGDRQTLPKLIEAAEILNSTFIDQLWSGNRALYQRLQRDTTPLGRARLNYFWLNKGPWDELSENRAFLPGVPSRRPPGADFYPEDMTKAEFQAWVSRLPAAEREQAEGFFTAIRRGADRKLMAVPYSQLYSDDLQRAARLLREAAALTGNADFKRFLNLRADAFASNNYLPSDLAWMDLEAPLEVTIGPYETYDDVLFGYKAAFEAYVGVRDDRETERLAAFAGHLQEIENNLPLASQFRNPALGAVAPIRVVNEIFASGDAAHGVATAAYNLPNDERVVKEKGSKRVILKNVQQAKFRAVMVPIATRLLAPKAQPDVSFEMFFTHILAHELMHSLGPHQITVDGRVTTPRQELKELYGAIEEAKADVTGLFALQYMMDHVAEMNLEGVLHADEAAERQLYITYLVSALRSLRFGLNDAHGKGMALQYNYFTERGAFVEQADGSFTVNVALMKNAVLQLAHDLLTLEATGDYAGAARLLTTSAVIRPNLKRALDRLQGVPADIEPLFETADELTGKTRVAEPTPVAKKPVKKTPVKKKRKK